MTSSHIPLEGISIFIPFRVRVMFCADVNRQTVSAQHNNRFLFIIKILNNFCRKDKKYLRKSDKTNVDFDATNVEKALFTYIPKVCNRISPENICSNNWVN